MRYHLYETKKLCPATSNDIVLTDDIKEHILTNRIYKVKDEVKIMNQTINNIQMINNFVANMDVVEKLNRVTDYCQVEITDFEDRVESCYARDVKRLEADSFKYDYTLGQNNFMTIIDKLTKAIRGEQRDEFLEDISVVYDATNKRIKVYSGKWEDYLVTNGLSHLIHTIVDYYLATYETYLIRKLCKNNITVKETSTFMECIREYYRFIASFEIDPYCKGKLDKDLLQREDVDGAEGVDGDAAATSDVNAPAADNDEEDEDEDFVAQRFTTIYNTEYSRLTNAQRKSVQKDVLDIIKTNSKFNIVQLDKDIIALVNIDPEFNKTLVGSISSSS